MATIGVPTEIKRDEQRVALTPDGVRELVSQGMEVRIEAGAGHGAGIRDDDYAASGARLVCREEAWAAHLVVKVKEPQPEEFGFLRSDLVLFTYLHLAAYPEVGRALLEAGTTSLAYETVQLEDGSLPLLAPMSEIAGRLAAQVGARLLEKPQGGRGLLMGGCTGVRPARGGGLGPAACCAAAACWASLLPALYVCPPILVEPLLALPLSLRRRRVPPPGLAARPRRHTGAPGAPSGVHHKTAAAAARRRRVGR
jgi:alanine dehydrogenase